MENQEKKRRLGVVAKERENMNSILSLIIRKEFAAKSIGGIPNRM